MESLDYANLLWEEADGSSILQAVADQPFSADGLPTEVLLYTQNGETVLQRLQDVFWENSGTFFGRLGYIIGILVLMSVFRRYKDTVRDMRSADTISLISSAVLVLLAYGLLADLLSTASAYFSKIHTLMTTAATTLTTLSAMRGMVTTASIGGAGMALFLAVTESICCGVLVPFVRLCSAFSLASSFGGALSLDALSAAVRKTFLWLTGGVMSVLCAVLSYQTVLARGADSVSMRAVRFTLSSVIPVVGGAVSEAATTVAKAFSLTQKTTGILGILLILWQLLPPLCEILLAKTVFSFGASVASLLQMDQEERLLRETESLAGFLCAVMTAEAIFFILMLTLCMQGI
ncbi:MAG: hypothetical protein IJC98_03745 [Clostridia bacterium]|nr:hypothetical protein [Clostridia bacterium]